jgi:hypothetical protein
MQVLRKAVQLGLALTALWIPLIAFAADESARTIINGHELTPRQINTIKSLYRYVPPPGRYWYDSRSGAWGVEGHETVGFILPVLDLGKLAANASNGDTGVFINGREINLVEAVRIQASFGAVYQGHWWLDGRTGYFGIEGYPVPLGNMFALIKSRQTTQGDGGLQCGRIACVHPGSSPEDSLYSVGGHVLTIP